MPLGNSTMACVASPGTANDVVRIQPFAATLSPLDGPVAGAASATPPIPSADAPIASIRTTAPATRSAAARKADCSSMASVSLAHVPRMQTVLCVVAIPQHSSISPVISIFDRLISLRLLSIRLTASSHRMHVDPGRTRRSGRLAQRQTAPDLPQPDRTTSVARPYGMPRPCH